MTLQRKIKRYGWRRDPIWVQAPVKYEKADYLKFTETSGSMPVSVLPSSVDLRANCPPVYDQFDLGSCTANAIAGAFEFDILRQKLTDFVPSRLFIYYNERMDDGDVSADAGSSISESIKAVENYGVCPETEWPYNISQFAVKPPTQCYTDGQKNKGLIYAKVANEIIPSVMKLCLSEGNPFVFGFTVYESFESDAVAQTGIVPMPATDATGKITESVVGGHAVMCVGYDDSKKMFLCRNSWGSSWGLAGYFWIPYEYLTNQYLAADFWTLKTVQ